MKNIKDILFVVFLLSGLFYRVEAMQVYSADIAPYVYPSNLTQSPRAFTYMPNGESYLSLNNDGKCIIEYSTQSGLPVDTILNVNKTRETIIDKIIGFEISHDGSKLLVYNDINKIYRRSFEAAYYVFEIKRNILKPLSNTHKKQRAPKFSPDSRMVAFVSNNNIYIKKIDYDSEVAVTNDGEQNKIINGVPDWTYEEEFMVESSMEWAPDNMMLSYIKYNETDVNSYSFPLYGSKCNSREDYKLYPGMYTYKYPKSGTSNSKVSVHCYNIETRKSNKIELKNKDIEYIPRIYYANSADALVIATLNRTQNRLEFILANPKTTVIKSLYVDESKSWIDEICYNNVKFYNDFFVVSSAKSGYNHLYKYSYLGVQLAQITTGEYDVLDYYGVDENNAHYFQSTKTGAINRVVSQIDKKGKLFDLTPSQGCASIIISPKMNYYVVSYSNVSTPPIYELYNKKNNRIRILEDNKPILSQFSSLPKREFIEIESSENKLNAYIIRPNDFDSSKKYPVIMTHYNGPASQSVLNKWSIDWENYYATQGYIIVCVDGRGTGGRGQAFQNAVYKNLGKYETIDLLAAAKYMTSQSYVDKSRIGIYGWSYGGYETLMAISQDDSPYSAAVAVAPVTDWRYYDTAYTERYMLTPQENESGYINSSTLNKVNNIKCPLLIISGTADDNVHLSNTMSYVSSLVDNGKYCDLFLFPDMNHSINGCNSRAIVYAKMLDYFNKNLKK